MELDIRRESLSHLMYLTNTIVERRNTMPILANVKLSARDNTLHVSATDLEVSLIGQIEAEIKDEGEITVSAKFLHDIVKELPGDSVSLKTSKGERLEIRSGQSHFKVNGISSDEFPSIMGVNLLDPVTVEAKTLYQMLDKTAYAVSLDETRYNINGVYVEAVEAEQDAVRFVATDGHRLAMIETPSESLSIDKGVIIPRKGIQELKKVIENNEGVAKVAIHDGFFTVQCDNTTLGIRLIDGEFPDYKKVLPSEELTKITVDRSEFLSTVKRVSLITTDKQRSIRFALQGGKLSISSSSPEYGEAVETIDVNQEGSDVEIGFSARYIIDILSAMSTSEQIGISLSGDSGPGLFTANDDESYRCVVMPLRFE